MTTNSQYSQYDDEEAMANLEDEIPFEPTPECSSFFPAVIDDHVLITVAGEPYAIEIIFPCRLGSPHDLAVSTRESHLAFCADLTEWDFECEPSEAVIDFLKYHPRVQTHFQSVSDAITGTEIAADDSATVPGIY
tara:strand:+ start:594 stop:998 length:405 start_codon:yes stop_codon:yes gene_type:complete